jgi:uncharacterized repeat protein (TIGR01451 family)
MKQLLSTLTLFFFLALGSVQAQITTVVNANPAPCWGQQSFGTVHIYGLTEAPDIVTANNQPQTILVDGNDGSYYFEYWFQGISQAIPITIIENGITIYYDVFYDFGASSPIVLYATALPADCNPGSYISVNSLSGGAPPYQITYFQVSSGTLVSSVSLLPGDVIVGVTDANGCTTSGTYTIPSANQGKVNLMTCGGPTATYNGIDYPIGSHILAAGTASTGCDSTVMLNVTADFSQVVETTGAGCSQVGLTGEILNENLSAQDLAALSFSWQVVPGASGSVFTSSDFTMTGAVGGDYMWIINTGYCADTTIVTDVQAAGLDVVIENTATCPDTLTASTGFGVAPLTYVWSSNGSTLAGDGNVFVPSPLAQFFTVTITDANGCEGINTFVIENDSYINPITANCVGKIEQFYVYPYTGDAYTYQWTGPNGFSSTEQLPTTFDNGVYTLVATSTASGCKLGVEYTRNLPSISFSHCDNSLISSVLGEPNSYFTFYELPSYTNVCAGGGCNDIPWPGAGVTYLYYLQTATTYCNATLSTDDIIGNCPTALSGYVYLDNNTDCVYNSFDFERPASIVAVASATDTLYTFANGDGYYFIEVDPGTYSVFVANTNVYEAACTAPVSQTAQLNTVQQLDLGLTTALSCGVLESSIEAGLLRRCINSNYSVRVTNVGTQLVAEPSVTIVLDSFFVFNVSSPAPTTVDGFTLTYDLSLLEPYEVQNIAIYGLVSCETDLGQTLCASAHALPDTDCLPDADGIEVEIDGICQTDSVEFLINNLDGPLTGVEYIIIEDQIILMQVPITMITAETFSLKLPANGSTYWMGLAETGNTAPEVVASKVVAGCGTGEVSTGFVNQFLLNDDLDASLATDETCDDVIFSYDPNDKQGIPTGYGEQHRILPNTTLDYKIRFQNTGNDTAFTVVLRDTLPAWLDITTFSLGASSHYNQVKFLTNRVVEWSFPNILLPSKNVNEVGSNGFVNFKITLLPTTPLNTVIENSAAIYFDFNEPVITDPTMHTVGIEVTVENTDIADQKPWSVFPNPTEGSLFVQPLGLSANDVQVEVTSLTGQLLLQETLPADGGEIQCDRLPAGMYFLRILEAGNQVAIRKIIVY